MAEIKARDVIEAARHELEMGRQTELVSWKQSYALSGIGFALLALVMIIEDLEFGDEQKE